MHFRHSAGIQGQRMKAFGWELVINGGASAEKSGRSWLFSVDAGYLENIGGRFRVVLFGWGLEVYGP